MIRTLSLFALTVPLAAQSFFGTTRHTGLPPLGSPVAFDRGDVDGDGDVDLVAAYDFGSVRLLLNDGNGRFDYAPSGNLVSSFALDNHAVHLVDIDGDGDLDLLGANEDLLPNFVFTNNGQGAFTNATATALPTNAFDTKNQVVADFDGDGDVDWLAVDTGGCHFYENDGLGVFTDASATRLLNVPLGLGDEWTYVPEAADLDGDGDLDAVVPGIGGLLENDNGVLTPFSTQLPPQAVTPHWLADVDGDGDIDLLANNGRRLFENQGNATFVDVSSAAFPAPTAAAYGAFDVDRDGDVDVVATNGIWLNTGNGTFSLSGATMPSVQPLLGTVPADFDGDGDLDIAGLPNKLHQLEALTAPTIGNIYIVTLRTRPSTPALAAVFGALGAGTTVAGAYGTLQLDPATVVPLGASIGGGAATTLLWPIPNNPALVGTALHYQAILEDPLVGVVVSNTFGDVVQ